ncbi:uncharacterized protein H6S33_009269 [Morchella sextelata]|uniref:uncharacterized protein n=1 Tax=Morchella sextelata TaxID=1174677 RepID=UPI001D05B5C8|nr:uncharacterized protein H6S33_009269 [Morchella sextelata]KAH0612889.1 hypothetical protein H6S33_009269 [Morchella sextelata]
MRSRLDIGIGKYRGLIPEPDFFYPASFVFVFCHIIYNRYFLTCVRGRTARHTDVLLSIRRHLLDKALSPSLANLRVPH